MAWRLKHQRAVTRNAQLVLAAVRTELTSLFGQTVARCMIASCLLGLNIFITPLASKHFKLVSITSCCHHFAVRVNVDKHFSGCRIQPVSDLRVDASVSRPVSLARGRINDLRENMTGRRNGLRERFVPAIESSLTRMTSPTVF